MFAQELSAIVERLQLGEGLEVTYAQFGHIGHSLCGGLCIQLFVELLHLAPSVDAVVVENCCNLHIGIGKIIPIYLGVFFFFFFGVEDFFGFGLAEISLPETFSVSVGGLVSVCCSAKKSRR